MIKVDFFSFLVLLRLVRKNIVLFFIFQNSIRNGLAGASFFQEAFGHDHPDGAVDDLELERRISERLAVNLQRDLGRRLDPDAPSPVQARLAQPVNFPIELVS